MQLGRRLLWGSMLGGGAYWLARYLRPQHSTLVLDGKVVLITGASSGIGRSLAFAFARRGARVVLVARRTEQLEAVRHEIEPYTADVLVIPADITDDAQLQQIVSQTLQAFGRIDVLVNNAGVSHGGLFQEQDPDRIERLLRVNLWAVIRLTQLVVPHMLKQHSGYILNVGSGIGRLAMPLFVPYVASKYGLSGFTDALRRELDGTGVHLTLVLPGWVHTEMITPEVEDIAERYGFRVGQPDDVAEQAVLGLVRGENEVILGGPLTKIGVWADRYIPFVVRRVTRVFMQSPWIDAMSGIR